MKLINFIKKHFWLIVFLITAVISTSLLVQNRQSKIDLAEKVLSLETGKTPVSIEVEKDGTSVTSHEPQLLEIKNLKDVISQRDKRIASLVKQLYRVDEISTSITESSIDTVYLPYDIPVDYVFSREGEIEDSFYSLSYSSNQNGTSIYNLKLTDTVSRVMGHERSWFLGKPSAIVKESHSNIHVVTVGASTFRVQQERRWYDTRLFNIGVGMILGVAVTR